MTLVFLPFLMMAQEREYVPLVEEGKVWYCGYELQLTTTIISTTQQ